jgi:uncharacterized membrane protein
VKAMPAARNYTANTAMPRPNTATRYLGGDATRGVAILLMFIYHFSFDLNFFGALRIDFNHSPFWLGFRALIVSAFAALVGVGLVLAEVNGFKPRPYFRRLGLIGACALLASAGSYLMFPASFIFFGILHFIFLASVLGRAFVKLTWTNLALGAALIIIGNTVQHPFFDQRPLQWFGLMTFKPITEDYVPLLPWFGPVLIGIFIARLALERNEWPRIAAYQPRHPLARALIFGGRHSLIIYMLHQPIFIATLWLACRLLQR